MYFLIFVGLQVLCLQNVYSQAIAHSSDTIVTETIEPIDSLMMVPQKEPALVNLHHHHQICPRCGHPVHFCESGYRSAVAISDSYSSVTIQPEDSPQTICPHCGQSAQLCTCGIPEVTETVPVLNKPESHAVCPQCGHPPEVCKCEFVPLVTLTEPTGVDEPDSGALCPNCGHPVDLCKCDFVSEAVVTEAGQNEFV